MKPAACTQNKSTKTIISNTSCLKLKG